MADLTTLDIVKADLKLSSQDTASDTQLSRMITEISTWFLSQVNRGALIEAGYTESRNGTGTDQIVPKFYPLLSIASVRVNGLEIPESDGNGGPGYVWDDLTISLNGYRFCRGRGNIYLAYTAGFTTVPGDIERAVTDQLVFTYRRLKSLGTITNSLGGVATTTFSQKEMAPGVQAVINTYRDRALVGL